VTAANGPLHDSGEVTDESKPSTRPEFAAQINQLHDIKAMKAAKQLQWSQKKAEEEAKQEVQKAEKAKKAAENETRNQIAAEVGSSRYEVEMLEKLKAKADSDS